MFAYQRSIYLFLLFSLPFLAACQKAAVPQNATVSEPKTTFRQIPDWVHTQIENFQQEKPANPPIKIYSYRYKGQLVYYITGRCCDIPSSLFTVEGQQLCQPDGGITGKGDGKCADFFKTRTEEQLVWEDPRN